jgi:hypothetical protein
MSTEKDEFVEEEEYYDDEPEDIRYLYDSDDYLEDEREWEAEFGDDYCDDEDEFDC